ncbi:MAG: tetratricopeptide repeat protein, partial [Planctomycetaceae bacterium]|nr:tetratricopeptide repeat protein [Planctomycetaceae bacterium]
MRNLVRVSLLLLLGAWPAAADEVPGRPGIRAAAELFLQGRLSEAIEAYQALESEAISDEANDVAAGLSEVYIALGDWPMAHRTLTAALDGNPDAAGLWGRLAELQFGTGDWEAARTSAEQALRRDSDALRARLVLAHLARETGRFDEALNGYRWFVRYYNRVQPEDAVSLRYVAEGSLEYARWSGTSSVFHFVVNTLCPDAIQADPLDWRTTVLSGNLLLEKYNDGQAVEEFTSALKLNPTAIEACVGLGRAELQRREAEHARELGDRALAWNSHSFEALLLRAEVELLKDDAANALALVEGALDVNPRELRALACRTFCDWMEGRLTAVDRW